MNIVGILQNEPQWLLVRLRMQARREGIEPPDPRYPTLSDAHGELRRNPDHPLLADARQFVAILRPQ